MSKTELKKQIRRAIEKSPYKDDIKKVSLFGSRAYGKPKRSSDIDILIDFMPRASIGYFQLAQIQRNFSNTVGRKVDLLTPQAISKYFRKEVIKKAEKIYER